MHSFWNIWRGGPHSPSLLGPATNPCIPNSYFKVKESRLYRLVDCFWAPTSKKQCLSSCSRTFLSISCSKLATMSFLMMISELEHFKLDVLAYMSPRPQEVHEVKSSRLEASAQRIYQFVSIDLTGKDRTSCSFCSCRNHPPKFEPLKFAELHIRGIVNSDLSNCNSTKFEALLDSRISSAQCCQRTKLS